jgi:hypothetical protein
LTRHEGISDHSGIFECVPSRKPFEFKHPFTSFFDGIRTPSFPTSLLSRSLYGSCINKFSRCPNPAAKTTDDRNAANATAAADAAATTDEQLNASDAADASGEQPNATYAYTRDPTDVCAAATAKSIVPKLWHNANASKQIPNATTDANATTESFFG